ncbi:hypothetical protein REPUB_Repub09cG0192000 [Reevesia pubescens]
MKILSKNTLQKCGERGSNTRPSDLQSDALPTELSPLDTLFLKQKFMISLPSMEISVHDHIFSLLLFPLLSLSFPPPDCEACNAVDDKEALLGFKRSITADPSRLLRSRISDCCSSWKGVACNSAGRVVNVTCPGLLTGSIPVTFKYFSRLENLYLSNNNISGTIPYFVIGSLKSLTELGLSANQLRGSIPATIGKLVFLTKLDIHANNLSSSLPITFGKLKSLNYVDLSGNQIKGNIPKSIGTFSFSTTISQSKPDYRKHLLRFPARFPQVLAICKTLILAKCNALTGKLPPWIGNMTRLSIFLNLAKNGFHSSIPAEFKNLRPLMDLDLHSNKFYGRLDTIFSKETDDPLGHFNTIDLFDTIFTGPISESVVQGPAMNSITLLFCDFCHIIH